MTETVTPPPGPRIVVGVDGSESSRSALRWAAALATATGARLDAVTTWSYPTSYGSAYVPLDVNPAQESEKLLVAAVDAVFGPDRPHHLRLDVRQGGAAGVLVEESRTAQMVVVGSRGHGGFVGLLLGSVSSSVAEHSACPVLVVHGDQAVPAFRP